MTISRQDCFKMLSNKLDIRAVMSFMLDWVCSYNRRRMMEIEVKAYSNDFSFGENVDAKYWKISFW